MWVELENNLFLALILFLQIIRTQCCWNLILCRYQYRRNYKQNIRSGGGDSEINIRCSEIILLGDTFLEFRISNIYFWNALIKIFFLVSNKIFLLHTYFYLLGTVRLSRWLINSLLHINIKLLENDTRFLSLI